MDRLRIVVDASLRGGSIAAQSVHAADAFRASHPEDHAAWMVTSNTIAILAADGAKLVMLRERALSAGLPVAAFHEPDMGDALTAIAIGPSAEARRLCRGLRLAG